MLYHVSGTILLARGALVSKTDKHLCPRGPYILMWEGIVRVKGKLV